MKASENRTKRLEVRVTEDELKLLKICSYNIGITPSALVRMFIDTTITSMRVKIQQGELNLEDYEAIFNDKL